jgi:hypothetical protein
MYVGHLLLLDVVLQDFCTIVGMENNNSPVIHERAWFRNVYMEAVGSLGQCVDTSAPLITMGTACLALPADACEAGKEEDPASPVDEESAGVAATLEILAALLIAAIATL